jgi:6-pyruvoyltetrahydropterin/6-carboxytetrahydropterin synthase
MITCTRRLTFEAGHRVMGHENKCAHPHGHSWKVWVTATSPDLDAIGRVIDFTVLKTKIGGWIDTHWDHAFIVSAQDTDFQHALATFYATLPALTPRMFVLPTNPTSEHLAHYLLHTVCPALLVETGVRVIRVIVQETENCVAQGDYEDLRRE